jgi:DNA repair exonuclease SbcCD ATPase subunit
MDKANNESTMAKEDLVRLLKTNLKQFNKMREESGFEALDLSDTRFQGATLTGAKLKNMDLSECEFEYANLVSADLSNCNLQNALMIHTNLSNVNLANADLEGADFTGAQLENSNLENANLSMAIFSKANFTAVNVNQTNLSSTNFCQANLSDTNFKLALNLRECIFDKYTRWPNENYLPKDFNPARGVYGSEEDFSVDVQEAQQGHDQQDYDQNYDQSRYEEPESLTPDELQNKLMDKIEISGKGLPEIEKKQILLDRKLDYIIANLKVMNERMASMPEGGGSDQYGYDTSYDQVGGTGGINAKIQELDEKVENIASILTRFPVKSLEETYKLIDVIKGIEGTQSEIYVKLNESVSAIQQANTEIQSILGGKLRASYISGLDKMFLDTIERITKTVNDAQSAIISESHKLDFNLDDTVITRELERQFGNTTKSLKEDLERKLGAHGLFLKQMDEKLESVRAKTDVQTIIGKLRDDIDAKTGQITELTDRVALKHEDQLNNLMAKFRVVDQKIDVMSQTSSLNVVSNLVAEFGAGFSSELQMVKDAALAIDNRLKGMTGEVDLSTDFAIDSIAKAVNKNLGDTVTSAIREAHMPTEDLKKLSDNLNQKLELLGKIFDAKTHYLEDKFTKAISGAATEDAHGLKALTETLAKQIQDLENMKPEEVLIQQIKEGMKDQMADIISHAKAYAGSEEETARVDAKSRNLQDINEKISEKLEQLYSNFHERSDVLEEKVDEIAQSELEELMNEFSQEVEELKESAGKMDMNTRETIKIQGISSQEIINNLREDLSASVEEVLNSLKTMDQSDYKEGSRLSNIKEDLSEKAEVLKSISDRISERMENLFDSVNKKTSQLEQKVDILAQAETDTPDILNDLLAEFEEDVNKELGTLRNMLTALEEKISDPAFTEVSGDMIARAIMEQLSGKVEFAVDKANEAIIKRITGTFDEKEEELPAVKDINEEEYDDTIHGDILFIKDVVSDIHSKMPEFSQATLNKIEESAKTMKEKLIELADAVNNKTGSIEQVMNEIVKEASSIPAASRTFDINEDLKQLKALAGSLDDSLKEVGEIEGKAISSIDIMRGDIEAIMLRAQEFAEQTGVEEISGKVNNLQSLSDKIKEIAAQVSENIDIGDQVSHASEDSAEELLEEFSAELEDLREFIHTSSTLTKESIKSQSIMNEQAMNNLREDLTSSIDRMMQQLAGMESGTLPISAQVASGIEGVSVSDTESAHKQQMMKEVQEKISGKIDSLLDTIQRKTKTLEQKVDILAQTETDNADVLSEMLAGFKDELLHELTGKPLPQKDGVETSGEIELESKNIVISKIDSLTDEIKELNEKMTSIEEIIQQSSQNEIINILQNMEKTVEEKIHSLKETTETLSDSLDKLDDTSYDNMVKRIDTLIDNGITIDTEILMDNIKAEIEEKFADLNITSVVASSVGELSHKIEKLYEDVMDLTIAMESKIDDIADKDTSDEIYQIAENLRLLKDNNLDITDKLETIAKDMSSEAMTDLITDIETSVSREVEFLKNIAENLNNSFVEFEDIIDTRKLENSLNELIDFNGELGAKLDKVLDATGNIDSEALLVRIKEHLEDKLTHILDQDVGLERILENLGSDLTEKMSFVMDHNQEIDAKLDKIMDLDKSKQMDNILSDIHSLKVISQELNKKLDHISDEVDFVEIIENFQNEISSSIQMFNEAAKAEHLVSALNETLGQFHTSIMEKTELLQDKVDTITQDEMSEGIDNIITDISLLRNLTEDITEKVERIINNTEGLQTEEGMQAFRDNLEAKLNKLLDSDQFNLDKLFTSINTGLGAKIDDYYNASRNYMSDILTNLEENIIANTTENLSVASFTGDAEESIKQLQEFIKDIKDISQHTLLTRADVEDLFSSIDSISTSLNTKTDSIMKKVEKQFADSDMASLRSLRRELEKRMETLSEVTTVIKDRIDKEEQEDIGGKLDLVSSSILEKMETLYNKLLTDTTNIESKVDTLASVDVVSQIDSLVSDVLVELDQEVDRIGKLTANVDRNIVALDNKVKLIHRVDQKVDVIGTDVKDLPEIILAGEGRKSGSDNALEALVGFMQKDADQKLLLMKELIHASSGKGGALEDRLKKLEEHIAKESQKHDEKLKNVLGSMKTLLDDMEGLKGFNPIPD